MYNENKDEKKKADIRILYVLWIVPVLAVKWFLVFWRKYILAKRLFPITRKNILALDPFGEEFTGRNNRKEVYKITTHAKESNMLDKSK
jgi:hypothetical protein